MLEKLDSFVLCGNFVFKITPFSTQLMLGCKIRVRAPRIWSVCAIVEKLAHNILFVPPRFTGSTILFLWYCWFYLFIVTLHRIYFLGKRVQRYCYIQSYHFFVINFFLILAYIKNCFFFNLFFLAVRNRCWRGIWRYRRVKLDQLDWPKAAASILTRDGTRNSNPELKPVKTQ